MDGLLPIGRFAQLRGLSVKVRHRYAGRGLLAPALVDLRRGRRVARRLSSASGTMLARAEEREGRGALVARVVREYWVVISNPQDGPQGAVGVGDRRADTGREADRRPGRPTARSVDRRTSIEDGIIGLEGGEVHILTPAEAWATFDEAARLYLQMSGQEFIEAWEAGRLDDDPHRPVVVRVAMLRPVGR